MTRIFLNAASSNSNSKADSDGPESLPMLRRHRGRDAGGDFKSAGAGRGEGARRLAGGLQGSNAGGRDGAIGGGAAGVECTAPEAAQIGAAVFRSDADLAQGRGDQPQGR